MIAANTTSAPRAAEGIAAAAGADVEPQPFHPVLRGRLITGDESLNLEADIAGGGGEGVSSLDYLWWPPEKIAGKYLSAQLRGGIAHEAGPPPEHGIDVEVSLGRDWHREPLGWGDGDEGMAHIGFTAPYNMSGQPAASVNCGFLPDGRAIGLQVAGRRFDDVGVLRAVHWYEQHRGAEATPVWPIPSRGSRPRD